MSLVPAFEPGIWNAWIFIIPLLAIHVVTERVLRSRGAEGQPSKIKMINSIPKEESQCLKKYGETYRKYMNRTPRWIRFL